MAPLYEFNVIGGTEGTEVELDGMLCSTQTRGSYLNLKFADWVASTRLGYDDSLAIPRWLRVDHSLLASPYPRNAVIDR
jgi:hypothetical protein